MWRSGRFTALSDALPMRVNSWLTASLSVARALSKSVSSRVRVPSSEVLMPICERKLNGPVTPVTAPPIALRRLCCKLNMVKLPNSTPSVSLSRSNSSCVFTNSITSL